MDWNNAKFKAGVVEHLQTALYNGPLWPQGAGNIDRTNQCTLGWRLFGIDSVLPYSIHWPSRFTYSTHMGSLLENVSSCTRSVHSINNSILRFRWKAFVWSVPCLPAFSVRSPPLLFEFSCGPLPSAATLGLFKDGVDLLLITVLAIIWNEKTCFSSRTFYLKENKKPWSLFTFCDF